MVAISSMYDQSTTFTSREPMPRSLCPEFGDMLRELLYISFEVFSTDVHSPRRSNPRTAYDYGRRPTPTENKFLRFDISGERHPTGNHEPTEAIKLHHLPRSSGAQRCMAMVRPDAQADGSHLHWLQASIQRWCRLERMDDS